MIQTLKRLIALAALICLIPAVPAAAATASELFADGNRLFRDDLYWAALLRYREAADAGMDTPLLHYNTGVAHYRAKQHARAREALQKSASYGPLAPISHYNLGLNAYAMDDIDQALRWFRRARDQEQRTDIRRLARRAIRQLEDEIKASAPVTTVAAERERTRNLTSLDLRVRVGAGVDDNVFRSPADPYIDFANPAQPLVTPVVQSGVYVPVSVIAKYQVNSLENEGFFGSYRFGGRFYQDKNLSAADEYRQEAAFGSEYRRRTEDRETRVYSAFKIAQHNEVYYDPDNGIERQVGGVDISDRMSYLRYGPEFWMKKRIGALTFGVRAKGQLWNYEEVTQVPEYDHEYWIVGLNGQYQFTSTSLLRLTAEYYTRRFGDRAAFELDGTQPLGNPTIRYDYTELGIEARQRITNSMWFSVNYERTDREDRHVGYNNYVRDRYEAEFHLQLGRRFDLEAAVQYNIYDYENAFAFHEPASGRKTLETATAHVVATFRMTQSLDLIAEYRERDVASNDFRIQYDRGQAMLGIRWSQ
jgi:tetratricopeptide (TPR) repeat protein